MAKERYIIDVDGERHIVDRRLTLEEERARKEERDKQRQESVDAHWSRVVDNAVEIANKNGSSGGCVGEIRLNGQVAIQELKL